MATREQFGDYLLLKKLTEDPLGETFRAGKVGDGGLEQVVLLRALNGPRLDAQRLAEGLPARQPIQQGLKSPTIGSGVGLGAVQGIPFVTYDYISGKNLATLLSEAERQNSPLPVDHGVLIAERVAQALAQAYETRLDGQRVLHGFVVPHLVRVSNEGETRLLGFEMGSLLQTQAGRGIFEPAVAAYLAPEVLAGEPGTKADDVYSLGALLFHLLTGHPPSASDPSGLLSEIDNARTAEEGQPIPAPLAALLKKSLTPRDQRIGEAVSWHRQLAQIQVDGAYNATPFNLAFFMHNLFRAEIEQENQELEDEKAIEVAPAAAFETEIVPAPDEGSGTDDGAGAVPPPGSEESKGGSKAGLWIGLAAVLLLAVAGGVYYTQFMGSPEPPAEPEPAVAQPVEAPEPQLPDPLDESDGEASDDGGTVTEGPTPEEIQAQIQEMISASSAEMEAKLKAQYEERLAALQRQLTAAEKAAEEQPEEEAGPAEGAREEEAPPPARQTRQAATGTETTTRPSTPTEQPTEQRQAATDGDDGATDSDGGTAVPTRQPTPVQPSEPEPRRSPPPERTREVAQEPAQVKPPDLVRPPQPRYPEIARRMNREATVLLRVLVDERGRVVEVERLGKRVGSGLDEAAVEAARQARYRPGTEDGVAKAMWTTLRVEFRP